MRTEEATAVKNEDYARSVIGVDQIDALIAALREDGYEVIGPKAEDDAIVYEPIETANDLPVGYVDKQEGGLYRLEKNGGDALFDYVVGPHSWKRYLYPSEQLLFRTVKQGKGFRIEETRDAPKYAFLGVRACEIAALEIHDKVFDNGDFADVGYLARRRQAFVVAVNCTRAGGTCFCASMNAGPKVDAGFDLALTEMKGDGEHAFLLAVGSERGQAVAAKLSGRPASDADVKRADAAVDAAAKSMGREMIGNVADVLRDKLESVYWDKIALRCLNCANCTMVCPTCFCSTMEDVTDLSGDNAERWRRWDSCFNIEFSYIHGGAIRREGSARYRQWMTHKLLHWHEQFDTSGCVGCGRCITWCPVGIDITEEARALRDF